MMRIWLSIRRRPIVGLLLPLVLVLVARSYYNVVLDARTLAGVESSKKSGRKEHLASWWGGTLVMNDSMPVMIQKAASSRQVQAKAALQRMKDQGTLTALVSSRDHVLKHGFPIRWDDCVLDHLYQEQRAFDVVVLGGASGTARHYTSCQQQKHTTTQRKPRPTKRRPVYKSLLQQKFHQVNTAPQLNVRVFHRGRPDDSVANTLLLDELVHPLTTNVLVWEDVLVEASDTTEDSRQKELEQARRLDFWLTRIHALYDQAGKRPPPILINYLWDVETVKRVKQTPPVTLPPGIQQQRRQQQHTSLVDRKPLQYTQKLIDSYRSLGWNIAVMNVGAVIKDHRLLLDDNDHPSCQASNLMAEMIQHAFYSNLAADRNCTSDTHSPLHHDWRHHGETQSIVPPHPNVLGDVITTRWETLWRDLFREDAVIGSLTAWEPRIHNRTNLKMAPQGRTKWPMTVQKNEPKHRDPSVGDDTDDLKNQAFWVPRCGFGSSDFKITINDPNLKWLGLGIEGKDHFKLLINGVHTKHTATPRAPWSFQPVHITQWVPVLEHVAQSSQYEISICRDHPTRGSLHHFVGVSVPPS
ncbi:expressed unknown protein [Seminavis robusta]|uniref:Uncharacterized protein n=1 Tax=Seminavis robusta TaxID=568900 RepID=A0A9N8HPI9_9STRA|nr:expressed unknown protein [Seminavis robusta]|eukprot:Sro1333_g263690.1 n/a (582) ;mRNA; f:18625-20370